MNFIGQGHGHGQGYELCKRFIVALKVLPVVAHLKIVAYLWYAGATMYILYQGRRGHAGLEQIKALTEKQVPLL